MLLRLPREHGRGWGQRIHTGHTHSSTGGPNGSGYIWTDHRRWSADTPESPLSILPLLHYRSWVDAEPADLRDAQLSCWFRGDSLELDGASCYFWIQGASTRWHLTSQPLSIVDGTWTQQDITLDPNPELWHCSWSPNGPIPVPDLLSATVSFGFSFVGFSREVTGRFSLADFDIRSTG